MNFISCWNLYGKPVEFHVSVFFCSYGLWEH